MQIYDDVNRKKIMKNNPFVGTGVALITPFNDDYSVDYKSLRNIVDFTLQNGAKFLVALGTTSEAPTLNAEEKANVVKTIVEAAAGRCPILLGMGGTTLRHWLKILRINVLRVLTES